MPFEVVLYIDIRIKSAKVKDACKSTCQSRMPDRCQDNVSYTASKQANSYLLGSMSLTLLCKSAESFLRDADCHVLTLVVTIIGH